MASGWRRRRGCGAWRAPPLAGGGPGGGLRGASTRRRRGWRSERGVGPMLPVIERLSLYPAETLLAVPFPPETGVRGLLVLARIGRQLEAEAAAVRAGGGDAAVRQQTDAEPPELAAAQARQATAAALDRRSARPGEAPRRRGRGGGGDPAAPRPRRRGRDAAGGLAGWRPRGGRRAPRQAAERTRRIASRRTASPPAPDLVRTARPARPRRSAAASPRGWGEPGDAGPTTGISYAAARGRAGRRPVGPRGVRQPVPQLWAAADRGLRRRLARGAGRDRPVRRRGRPERARGRAGGRDAGLGPAAPAARGQALYLELRHGGRPVNPAPSCARKADAQPGAGKAAARCVGLS